MFHGVFSKTQEWMSIISHHFLQISLGWFAPLMLQLFKKQVENENVRVLAIVNLFWTIFLTENLWERTFLISEDFNDHWSGQQCCSNRITFSLSSWSRRSSSSCLLRTSWLQLQTFWDFHNLECLDRLKGSLFWTKTPFNCFGCQIRALLHCLSTMSIVQDWQYSLMLPCGVFCPFSCFGFFVSHLFFYLFLN